MHLPADMEKHRVGGAIIAASLDTLLAIPEIHRSLVNAYPDFFNGQGFQAAGHEQQRGFHELLCTEAKRISEQHSSLESLIQQKSPPHFFCHVFTLCFWTSGRMAAGDSVDEYQMALRDALNAIEKLDDALGPMGLKCRHILMMAMQHRVMDLSEAQKASSRRGLRIV
jgi:hypothetical protein